MELSSPASKIPLVGSNYARKLEKLGIFTIEDFLHHIPARYKDLRIISDILNVQAGETITIRGTVKSMKNIYTKYGKKLQVAEIADTTGVISAVWFNQTYLVKSIKAGEMYSFSGKVETFNNKLALMSPDYESYKNGDAGIHTGRLVPVYPETAGVSSKWLRSRVNHAYNLLENDLEEFLPDKIISEYNLLGFSEAIREIHFPDKPERVEPARRRLAFNELLFHQLKSLYRKGQWNKNQTSHKLKIEKGLIEKFIAGLNFTLTNSQMRSINEIIDDLGRETPMNRLLEGDVGSGKTIVAAAAAFAAFINGYQTIFMAPTQILADQHYKTLKEVFSKFKMRVSLVTSSRVESDFGRADIFVGTHALIHKKVKFDNVALVVIDEQHRFGVEQRAHLIQKSKKGKKAPNVLTMTATPIPRTVALTIYGDLDLSTLDELPKGRKSITTWIVPPQKRKGAYGWISEQIKKEHIQVFFVCPLIEESEVESMKTVKAAKKVYEDLKKEFASLSLGLLHGKQKVKEKNEVLDAFRGGEIDILVSTPVVEVGIDVANATIMVIEAGERYGLAQLHQLRGRIGRGSKKSYCLVFTENKSSKVLSRLNALKKSLSGFELAELDMKMRGPGEVFGTRQHGYIELKVASWSDSDIIKATREVAEEAIGNTGNFKVLINKLKLEQNIAN